MFLLREKENNLSQSRIKWLTLLTKRRKCGTKTGGYKNLWKRDLGKNLSLCGQNWLLLDGFICALWFACLICLVLLVH